MENKYYVPDISEFCVGFEYERNEPHRVYYKDEVIHPEQGININGYFPENGVCSDVSLN